MQLIIDTDLHQAIQSVGARTPTSPIGFKSQDTPALNVYFVSQGIVLDLGESPVIKFGLVVASAITTFLSYDATFTRQVDANGSPFYQAFPVFNTSETVTALGSLASLPCVGELRYQLADGEIIHVLDIPFVIYRTILTETGTPDPTLIPSYPDVSAIEILSHKDAASGYAALDSGGHLTPSVIPSTVELIATRDVASGHAGLDSDALLLAAEIPVDGTTVVAVAGKISALGPALGVVAITTEVFTVPAVSATVPVSVPTSSLTVGSYYVLSGGAGLYQFSSATDSTHGVFLNVGSALNAVAGTVIAFGANLTWSGPPGPAGAGTPGADGPAGTSFTWRGAWAIGTAYAVNDVVSQSGSVYICSLASTGENPLTDGGVHWSQMVASGANGTNGTNGVSFIWMGAWSSGTAYVANNVVSQAGSTWINILANTGSTPSTDGGTHWALMAEVGSSTGDMVKSTYDTAVRGYVDRAVLADTATLAAGLSSGIAESLVTGLVTDLGTLATNIAAKSPTLVDDETSAGLTLLGSTAGHVKRLIAGTNVTLDAATTAGGIIIASSGGGGGGGVTPIHVQVTRASNWTYADTTAMPWDSALSDSTGMWSGGAPTRLTVATAGVYLFTAQLILTYGATVSAGSCFNIGCVVNGNLPKIQQTVTGVASQGIPVCICGILVLAATDYVELMGMTIVGTLPSTVTKQGSAYSPFGPFMSLDLIG